MIKKISVFFAAVLLLTAAFAFSASAAQYAVNGIEIPIDIVVNGSIIKTPADAFLENGITYVPVRALSEALGAVVAWDDVTRTASVTKADKNLTFAADGDAVGAVLRDGTLFVPARVLSEGLGYTVGWDDYYCQVNVTAPDVIVAPEHIETAYTNADILIVAQVLQCECGASPFDAKIAVANVICNRAESELFPDTVTEVIYDRRYGSVQFAIAYNGKLNNTPSKECILAAKCALNGTVIAENCLFFQADYVENSWMDRNRQYAMSIGGNTFFY